MFAATNRSKSSHNNGDDANQPLGFDDSIDLTEEHTGLYINSLNLNKIFIIWYL